MLTLLVTLLLLQQQSGRVSPQPVLAAGQPAPPASPPGTDIYELVFDGTLDHLKQAKPQPVTIDRGYDNQPFFTPDGAFIWFTSNRDGKQTDILEFDRKTRKLRPLINTPESEYSAALTPDAMGISVIRVETDGTQRLWRFDRSGGTPRPVLTDIKPVGYHAWIDDDQLALFVLGEPSTLQLARVSTGKAIVVARDIGRSLHRMPNSATVSFVHREGPDNVWVKQFDPVAGAVTPLIQLTRGDGERDVAWTRDATLLSSVGTRILAWRAGEAGWREVYDVAPHQLGAVTRMAVAPDGKLIAIVVAERTR